MGRNRHHDLTSDVSPVAAKQTIVMVGAVILLLLVSRLPLLLSQYAAIDGDEAVVGIMAHHLLEGRSVPPFFYGQSYGFALVEAGLAALYFAIFGVSELALRSAVLTLWGIGLLLFGCAVGRLFSQRAAIIALLFATTCPAWLLWSMKARGGYVTAWTLANLALFIIVAYRHSMGANFLLGSVLALVYFSQPLMLLLPLTVLLWILVGEHQWRNLIAIGGGILLIVGALGILGAFDESYWKPQLFGNLEPIRAMGLLPGRIWTLLGGLHWYAEPGAAGKVWTITTGYWSCLLLLFVVSVLNLSRKGALLGIMQQCLYALLCFIMIIVFFEQDGFGCRYLLPMVGPFIFGFSLIVDNWIKQAAVTSRCAIGMVGIATVLVVATSIEIGSMHPSDIFQGSGIAADREIHALVASLHNEGIEHVYSMDPLLQWNIMFASRQTVVARWFHPRDRIPAYPAAVDRAHIDGGPTALVGMKHDHKMLMDSLEVNGNKSKGFDTVAERFFVLKNPDRQLLRKLGFVLNIKIIPG